MISGFCCGVNEIFTLVVRYTAQMSCHRHFRATYSSYLQESSIPRYNQYVILKCWFPTTSLHWATSRTSDDFSFWHGTINVWVGRDKWSGTELKYTSKTFNFQISSNTCPAYLILLMAQISVASYHFLPLDSKHSVHPIVKYHQTKQDTEYQDLK
jgi:hypothetical protein